MKKENKKNNIKIIKISTIVLLIVLVSMISVFGIYKQNKNQMENSVKDYSYSMVLNGARAVELTLSEETNEVIKDSEGNVIESATDEEIEENGYTTETALVNLQEDRTEENYEKAKKVIEGRLEYMGVLEYNVNYNKTTGQMTVEMPEDDKTDDVVNKLATLGKFEIIDTETKEVLLDNRHIESSDALYSTTTSGTSVYLEIVFNDEGKNILKDISDIYVEKEVETTDEETGETKTTTEEKTITMKINDQELMTTHFDSEMTSGKLQLMIGTASTDTTTLQGYIDQAQRIAVSLNNGNLPLKYQVLKNQYVLSDVSNQDLFNVELSIIVAIIVGVIVLFINHKTNGLLAGISFVGFAAIYTLIVRYTNVVISIESIFGLVLVLAFNYLFTSILLKNVNKKIKEKVDKPVRKATLATYKKFINIMIPLFIISIAFCFVKWVPVSSFGTIVFWGTSLIAIYNAIITRCLVKTNVEGK